jgi:BirA family transcriptional regulator, biotin operon repressor / biotin---[acetyl-CoA-carboxylase] ligase
MLSGFSSQKKALDVEQIQRQLETRFFGIEDKLIYLPIVDSTNVIAMQLASKRPDEGVVVLTDSQTAGKGRLGRRWVDVFGCNVLSSTLLRPLFPLHFLVMIASLAVVDAIAETCGSFATIKWPNDVLIGDRKVAGILIETSHDRSGQLVAIMGIGVNVNCHIQNVPVGVSLVTSLSSDGGDGQQGIPLPRQTDMTPKTQQTSLMATATTLESECGHVVSREALIAHLLRHIETDYLALQQEVREPFSMALANVPASHSVRERWRSQLSTLGRPIAVRQGETVIDGVAEDVNENGELLLRSHSGELVSITWGDVGYPTG